MENPTIKARKFKNDTTVLLFIKIPFYVDKHSEPTQVK
jgi:hypothetical protein